MTLLHFLRNQTRARELCVICRDGWIVATCWIDHEDLFLVPQEVRNLEVKKDEWGYLSIVNKTNRGYEIPCHYVYL